VESVSGSERNPLFGPKSWPRFRAWWRTANYLSVGQIYLLDNPLLRVPLTPEHVKPRLPRALGHDARAELRLRAHESRDQGAPILKP